MQLIGVVPSSIFGVKATPTSLTYESPAFGVSTNGPILIDKIPNIKDDKNIKQPVAVKPSGSLFTL